MQALRYYGLQARWRISGWCNQFPAMRYPRVLFYVISHERSGTHFLINTLLQNARLRRGMGFGVGAGWGRHNIGEWYGPYDEPARRYEHIQLINARWRQLSSRAAIIKSHCDRALFEQRFIKAPVVYITRDPRDTMVSWFHYLNQDRYYRIHPYVEDMRCGTLTEFLRRPLSAFLRWNYAWEPSFNNVVERWAAHVAGWLRAPDRTVLSVRFEDLKRSPRDVLERIAGFAGFELKPVFRPVRLLDGESMFPRSGGIDRWKQEMSPQDERFILGVMDRFEVPWPDIAAGSAPAI